MLDAIGAHEVRKIGYTVSDATPDWDRVQAVVSELHRYARDYRDATRVEVLSICYRLACEARRGMTLELAEVLSGIVSEATPFVWRAPSRDPTVWKEKGPEHLRVSTAAEIGRILVYDAARYLKSIPIARTGAEILGVALHAAHGVQPRSIFEEVDGMFQERIAAAQEFEDPEIERLLHYFRSEALRIGSGDFASVEGLL